MAQPFTHTDLLIPTFWERLFKKQNAYNAILELQNILAGANAILDISAETIQDCLSKYSRSQSKWVRTQIPSLYLRYLNYCLEDKKLSEQEIKQLGHLKSILHITDAQAKDMLQAASLAIYKTAVKDAIEDGVVTPDEQNFLQQLQTDLCLPDDITTQIYESHAVDFLNSLVHQVTQDERLSPQEEEQLSKIATNLHIPTPKILQKQELNKYRLYWLIENGELPQVDAGIKLFKGEKCYFAGHIDWYEKRTVTKRIRYSGPTARIKIMKGVYWRMGDLAVAPVSEEITKHIDSGDIFITNKRLLFMGDKKNSNIRLHKILDFTPYSNGIEIEKDAGYSPIFMMDSGVDIFAMILERALQEYE